MTTAPPIDSLSLSTAAALTGRSTRTWQRRIEDGQVARLSDASGRTLVPLAAVRPALSGQWDEQDIQTLLRADRGEADAMHWLGLLHAAGLGEAGANNNHNAQALMWIAKAAEHGHAIAQQQINALLASLTK